HKTMENYIDAKLSVAKNQTEDDFIVLNYEDPVLRKRAEGLRPQVIWFSSKQKINGFYFSQGAIFDNTEGFNERIVRAEEMNILGLHNMENAMAAAAMAKAQGVPVDDISDALRVFKAVEHRIEYVRTLDDIIYYNDSKGTNTDAAIKAIEAMTRPAVVIGGGYDKHSEFDDWIECFPGKVRALVLIGETKEKIAACAEKHGFTDCFFAGSLEEAVLKARELAHTGDAVLLSPACASWDMFKNFEERGRMFKALVNELR
ncbi:MAG: UDP-N-acetylmuramoyl-L-alanine--D-glutamate ligase, partial [Lachnospiraceae bacterium]|nr:UDP-N-acetylmuramoyl-L-alanine--D-glutamate ligase [Lachnospiraceae bacterium]